MTNRFIQKNEIERLTETADKGDTLLLSKGEFTDFFVYFIGDTKSFKKGEDFFLFFVVGYLIF